MFPSEDGAYIYLLGGYGIGSTASHGLTRYEIATGLWTKLADVPRTIANGSFMYPPATEVDGQIVSWYSTESSIYTIATDTWVSTRGTPSAASGCDLSMGKGVTYEGNAYSFGYGSTYSFGTNIVKYDPVTKVFSRVSLLAPASKLISYPPTALIGSKIYVSDHSETLSWYDLETNTWGSAVNPLGMYTNSQFASLKGKLYMLGAGANTKDVWIYDPDTGEFSVGVPTTVPVAATNTVTAGPDHIYLLVHEVVGNVTRARFYTYTPE
jgi:hypothetical protein